MSATSCDTPGDTLLEYEDALTRMLARAASPGGSETVALDAGLGRVLHAAVDSRIDVPSWDNSAMDGYALRCADLGDGSGVLPVSQRIPAGSAAEPLAPGSAARIFTGAPIPAGADAVVMQEHCTETEGGVRIAATATPGQNIRRAGEDIAAGSALLAPGTLLAPEHLGLAASVGVAELEVRKRLRVTLLTSGDELVMPGEPIAAGQIYNSNRFTGAALLRAIGCDLVGARTVPDNYAETVAFLRQAAAEADLILATGGVSVGEEDHIKPAIDALGSLALWKIAVRPGKPVAFGEVAGTPIIGTPGNPVSLYVTFLLFALPYIRRMQGLPGELPRPVPAIADFDWPRPDSRREFMRVRMRHDADGNLLLTPHPSRSSGVLSSVTWADGLAIIDSGRRLARGDRVDFLEFRRLLA